MERKISKLNRSDKNTGNRDQYTVVLEDLRSQFKVFGEGLLGLNQKVDNHTEKLESITEKLDNHSAILDSHTEMIAQIMVNVTEIKHELKQKVDREEFAKLEKRVLMLEQRKQSHSI